MSNMTDHDKWCRDQHKKNEENISRVFTKLGTMEVYIKEQANCTAEVREELKTLNNVVRDLVKWTSKKDGANKALAWAFGIGIPAVLSMMALVWKIAQ